MDCLDVSEEDGEEGREARDAKATMIQIVESSPTANVIKLVMT